MTTMDTPESETERLRRHLRALSAVNNQLHSQLESGVRRSVDGGRDGLLAGADGGDPRTSTLALRRADAGSQWIEQLQLYGSASAPFLVRNSKRGNFLVEGPLRRRVKAGMLFVALEGVVGASRAIGDAELDRWNEGPPVEVLEAPSGPAFVIVAGRRLTLRGLPLPNPVTADEMLRFPEGQELRIGASTPGAAGGRRAKLARAGGLLRRDGLVRGGGKVLKRGTKKVVRKLRSAAK
ncbi:MAG: hypothetical protein QOJ71_417 [Actinomycetota bacterium]|jgi:hypothetical protein|nr:hypothetical protein [Actinomycetota bacterium]